MCVSALHYVKLAKTQLPEQMPSASSSSEGWVCARQDASFESYVVCFQCYITTVVLTFVCSGPSTSIDTLRKRRELRYSREEEALSKRLDGCSDGAPIQDLQIRMLEQAGSLLKSRISEIQQRLADVRKRLTEGTAEDEAHEELLRQRWLEEQKLSVALDEERKLSEEVAELQVARRTRALQTIAESSTAGPSQATRKGTNLNAFMHSTTSVHPFQSFAPHSNGGKASMNRHGRIALRNSTSVTYRSSPYLVHSRSKSLGENAPLGRLHHVDVGTVRHTKPYNLPKDRVEDSSSRPGASTHDDTADLVVAAVDEFNNSFSSRVMPPPRFRPRRQSSIRSLQITNQQKGIIRPAKMTLPKKGEGEFGNVAIFSAPTPQSNASDLRQNLSDVQLPSYVQSLMDELSQETAPPLDFRLGESEVLTFTESVPLSSILESPLTPSTPNKVSSQLPPLPSTPTGQGRKKRSIFTLHLPMRAVPGSPSRSTLAASSSSVSEAGDNGSQIKQTRSSPFKLRKKGLPSTQLRDLALMGAAPDDILDMSSGRETPKPAPTSPRKGKVSGPVSALREVRSKLSFFGR